MALATQGRRARQASAAKRSGATRRSVVRPGWQVGQRVSRAACRGGPPHRRAPSAESLQPYLSAIVRCTPTSSYEPAVGRRIRDRGLGHLAAPTRGGAHPPPAAGGGAIPPGGFEDDGRGAAHGAWPLAAAGNGGRLHLLFYARGGTEPLCVPRTCVGARAGCTSRWPRKTRYRGGQPSRHTRRGRRAARAPHTVGRVREPVAADASYYSLGGVDRPRSFPSTQVNLWLKVLLVILASPPLR